MSTVEKTLTPKLVKKPLEKKKPPTPLKKKVKKKKIKKKKKGALIGSMRNKGVLTVILA